RTIYTDPRFWKIAPLSATCVGSAWALQGLWASPWMADVAGLDRAGIITDLFVMAMSLSMGAWLLGIVADRLRRKGIRTEQMLAVVGLALVAAESMLVLRVPVPAILPWSVVALVGAGVVLSFAITAEYFPPELAGRANGALNMLHFAGAFLVQYGIGLVLEQWPHPGGHYPADAYQKAFGMAIALQVLALAWIVLPRRQILVRRFGSFRQAGAGRAHLGEEFFISADQSFSRAILDGGREW
ncbi:MAG: MFS transporter, partial [Bradyrhizobium sp.]|uniref:MFS transporter n=1 Tax=Bradyrhizobium sp. TaxID=376 RepID=UPI001D3456B5